MAPAAAAARATALIDASPDGVWTAELQEQARACFECEAAAIEIVVCMPEVFARSILMSDPRYQVTKGDEVVGCKLFCPGCESNKFVLLGEVTAPRFEPPAFRLHVRRGAAAPNLVTQG